jgi:hypothetical protein
VSTLFLVAAAPLGRRVGSFFEERLDVNPEIGDGAEDRGPAHPIRSPDLAKGAVCGAGAQ